MGHTPLTSIASFDLTGPLATNQSLLIIMVIATIAVASLVALVRCWVRNPFHYPYFHHDFDVTGRRLPSLLNEIDEYLCVEENRREIEGWARGLELWKRDSEARAQEGLLTKRRRRQLAETIDDAHGLRFSMSRQRTRYRQADYVRTPYKVSVCEDERAVSLAWVRERCRELEGIGYAMALEQYERKDQRRLMTPELRRRIMERDHYTCQICGKRMEDEVGLHIDHIVPVSKGGKSVERNLQVLCDRCNRRKGARMDDEG